MWLLIAQSTQILTSIFYEDTETTDFFFQYIFTEALWTDMCDMCLYINIQIEPSLQKDIVYGFVSENRE